MKKEEKTTLTPEQIEYLSLYFLCFKKAYYMQTRTDLTTVDQIIKLIKKGDFTFEDVYNTHLDISLRDLNMEAQNYWDDNMSKFDFINYFPSKDKLITDGAWIKIRNENGFEIHYAKTANRKRRFQEEHEAIQKKYVRILNKQLKNLKDETNKVDDVRTPSQKLKEQLIQNKLSELEIFNAIGLKLYEVKIMRTKNVAEYYLPSQYEIIEDIEEFSNAYINNIEGVSMKALYTSQNKDVIFYLQSRGINKKVAEMMAALKQTYFKVNMKEAMDAYNKQLRESVVFVEA